MNSDCHFSQRFQPWQMANFITPPKGSQQLDPVLYVLYRLQPQNIGQARPIFPSYNTCLSLHRSALCAWGWVKLQQVDMESPRCMGHWCCGTPVISRIIGYSWPQGYLFYITNQPYLWTVLPFQRSKIMEVQCKSVPQFKLGMLTLPHDPLTSLNSIAFPHP